MSGEEGKTSEISRKEMAVGKTRSEKECKDSDAGEEKQSSAYQVESRWRKSVVIE